MQSEIFSLVYSGKINSFSYFNFIHCFMPFFYHLFCLNKFLCFIWTFEVLFILRDFFFFCMCVFTFSYIIVLSCLFELFWWVLFFLLSVSFHFPAIDFEPGKHSNWDFIPQTVTCHISINLSSLSFGISIYF